MEGFMEVPERLQTLARMVVRGFYTTESSLIIDMLVRNVCMSEKDLCDLLKFDRKMLRQQVNILRADHFIQARMRKVTLNNKMQDELYYFIDYKSLVNVVKYKLDKMRKKLEKKERDQTSRASFICHCCQQKYTDLEVGQLLDIATGQLLCTICEQEVQEDMSGMLSHDDRLLLRKFNEQMEPLFNLLHEVENITQAAEFSEQQPKDFSYLKKPGRVRPKVRGMEKSLSWSGNSTKKSSFQVEGTINVNISADGTGEEIVQTKKKPIWLCDATPLTTTSITSTDTARPQNDAKAIPSPSYNPQQASNGPDNVMRLLQIHEHHAKQDKSHHNSDSDSEDSADEMAKKSTKSSILLTTVFGSLSKVNHADDVIEMGDTEDEEEDSVPQVSSAGEQVAITEVDNSHIAHMTQEEKNAYVLTYLNYTDSLDD